jgi:hypothetical protein
MMRTMRLLEFTRAAGPRGLVIDRKNCVVRGCKLLGSRGNSDYPRPARERAIQALEGARVFIDHPPPGQRGARGYAEQFGRVRNVHERGDGLWADLFFNPKHALAEQFLWDAQHSPDSVGFSINTTGRGRTVGGRYVVEEILFSPASDSVDLVSRPATTKGLNEALSGWPPAASAGGGARLSEAVYSRAAALGVAGARGHGASDLDREEARAREIARLKAVRRGVRYVQPGAEVRLREEAVQRMRQAGRPGQCRPGDVELQESARAAEVRRLKSFR